MSVPKVTHSQIPEIQIKREERVFVSMSRIIYSEREKKAVQIAILWEEF